MDKEILQVVEEGKKILDSQTVTYSDKFLTITGIISFIAFGLNQFGKLIRPKKQKNEEIILDKLKSLEGKISRMEKYQKRIYKKIK